MYNIINFILFKRLLYHAILSCNHFSDCHTVPKYHGIIETTAMPGHNTMELFK